MRGKLCGCSEVASTNWKETKKWIISPARGQVRNWKNEYFLVPPPGLMRVHDMKRECHEKKISSKMDLWIKDMTDNCGGVL